MEEKKVMTRAQQKTEDTWNMEDMYANETLYREEGEQLDLMMKEFAAFQGTLKDGSGQFLKVLQTYEKMNHLFDRLFVYANQKSHEDTANAKYQQMCGEVQIEGSRLGQYTAWLEPEILALPEDLLASYFDENEELEGYRRFVEQITRRRAHVLDAGQEALMAKVAELGAAPDNIFSMFNNADIRFPDVTDGEGNTYPLTSGTYVSYLQSSDIVLRKNAFEAMYKVYGQFQNTLGATYYANLKQADFFAKQHGFETTLEKELFDSEIPTDVYTNLLEAIHSRLPYMYDYVSLRKRLLGLPELHMYDVYVPIVKTPEKTYSFEEAKEIVLQGLKPLGDDYLALLRQGFENRWIDVYENQGKYTGAYSWGAYGTHPYVLLNYNGTLDDVFTLAHEMGHALHTWYSYKNQRFINSGYRMFVAEVASTCNEALLIHDMMNRTEDPVEKKYLINHFLEQFKGTMYRQAMFAEFEMLTHKVVNDGGMLTSEQLKELYLTLNKRYFGEEMISDPEIALEWAKIPHFYTPFYVYQYATGYAAAIAISSKILAGEEGIVEKYKQFLSGGCSMSPIDLLKICGVDMSSPKPVEDALDVFGEYVKKLGEL